MKTRATIAFVLVLSVACGSDEPAPGGQPDVPDIAEVSDAGPADVPEDAAAPPDAVEDLVEDVVPDEQTVEDIPGVDETAVEDADTPPENLPPVIAAGAMFRVNWVQVLTPSFYLSNPDTGEVVDVSAAINAYLGSHLTTVQQPLDIIGLFEPFDFAADAGILMSFGRGDCERDGDGEIIGCQYYDEPTFFEDTAMQPPFKCTAFSGSDACYTTTETNMSLDLAGVPLGFTEAFTAGKFVLDDAQDPTGLTKCFVQGFMDKPTAEATVIYVPAFGDLVLADLLDENELIDKDGDVGWWFEVNYKAARVPKL